MIHSDKKEKKNFLINQNSRVRFKFIIQIFHFNLNYFYQMLHNNKNFELGKLEKI